MKWVPFVKLAFSLGNRSKMGLFSAFSHCVFNDCGPNPGFDSDLALSPILTPVKIVISPSKFWLLVKK